MKPSRNIMYFIRNMRTKHRLSFRQEHDQEEVWYMHISPFEIIGSLIALVLILFIIILTLAAYTPILNFIPGYTGNRSREALIQNIMRIDSMERRMTLLETYGEDISVILDGRTPVLRNIVQATTDTNSVTGTIPPNAIDSAIRRQMEGSGIYSLDNPASARRSFRSGIELTTPVRGVVATHFDPRDNRYGVGVATASNSQILAIDDGTVTISTWTPEDGYVIQIQHTNNLLSVYKRSSQSLKPLGSRVRAGEVIGSTGEGISGEDGKGLFGFELWYNGTPVDPESYIAF